MIEPLFCSMSYGLVHMPQLADLQLAFLKFWTADIMKSNQFGAVLLQDPDECYSAACLAGHELQALEVREPGEDLFGFWVISHIGVHV